MRSADPARTSEPRPPRAGHARRFLLLQLGVLALSPANFGRLIADETEKWGKVIRAANIKAE